MKKSKSGSKKKVKLVLETSPIKAKKRKLKGKWTVEMEQSLEQWSVDEDGYMKRYEGP